MKKLLLGSVAILGLAAMASPAVAGDGVSLDVSGHFKGYTVWSDQDTAAAQDERNFDILRETEIHFSGETTLDNGMTVGIHIEADTDAGDGFAVDESYAYFSGAWGRLNFGDEDGAAYLLQVAAPSADSNFDGIRQYVNPVNYQLGATGIIPHTVEAFENGFDYANDAASNADKITYLTPVINGFQGGVSYTPDIDNDEAAFGSNSLGGVNEDDAGDVLGEAWEIAARWEGQLDELGVNVGAGYTHIELERDAAGDACFLGDEVCDDFKEWNVGADLDWGAFGVGVVYTENNNGVGTGIDNNETWVVGLDYTTGPFKLGASWLNNDTDIENGVPATTVETDRWTGGVVYTYGPGMTFRGSLSFIDHDIAGGTDIDATSILLGTQINF